MSVFLEKNRSRVEETFEKLAKHQPSIFAPVKARMEDCEENIRLALKYLYGNMPVSDVGNYPFDVFLDYAAHGVMLWERYERVRRFPEELFLNYVLYHRINEEEIDVCRSLFYQSILSYGQEGWTDEKVSADADWIGTCSEEKLALEVNFWCGREATYQSADDRTASALTVFRSGHGRCGEESVFAANALRSVGIPARQVYAPKWSHCDDNHAWAEVFVDGAWHFLGACEPAARLDHGWFNGASSRAMLVHSRWFDSAQPQAEEMAGKEGMTVLLNQLERYADTEKVCVTVRDESGMPVPDALAAFQVLNYAELAPIAELLTDKEGKAELTTGLGSLYISVRKDGKMGECILDNRKEHSCTCVLGQKAGENAWESFDMFAPKDHIRNRLVLTEKEQKAYQDKLDRVTARRMEKTRNFKNPEIERFENGDGSHGELRRKLLGMLTAKDQLDLKADVLEEHLQAALPYEREYPEEVFIPYILSPRIFDEVLMPWRKEIQEGFSKEEAEGFRKAPEKIWETIQKRITEHPFRERSSVFTTPAAALKLGIASRESKKILFVAVARTFGIPARLNPMNKGTEYWMDGAFHPVLQEETTSAKLVLKKDTEDTVWNYRQNWTLGRLVQGSYQTLDLSGLSWEEEGLCVGLVPGSYRLLTANRLPNGNQFSKQYRFTIGEGEKQEIGMELRKAELTDLLSSYALPDFTLTDEEGKRHLASQMAEKESVLFIWLEEGKEPTEHILNEIVERKEAFAACAGRTALIIRSHQALTDPTLKKCQEAVPEIPVYFHDFGRDMEPLARGVYTEPGRLPLILVAKKAETGAAELIGLYGTSGYNVGTGDMVLRILNAEKQFQSK